MPTPTEVGGQNARMSPRCRGTVFKTVPLHLGDAVHARMTRAGLDAEPERSSPQCPSPAPPARSATAWATYWGRARRPVGVWSGQCQ